MSSVPSPSCRTTVSHISPQFTHTINGPSRDRLISYPLRGLVTALGCGRTIRESLHGSRVFFFQAEDGIRDLIVTGVQTCALPISLVRARINVELKMQAAAVLKANDLELSDAIRLFLRQVVRRGGLPFAVRDPGVRVVSGKQLWAMKRKAQARDHALAARGDVPPEAMLLLRPKRLEGAGIRWPGASA